MDFDSLFHRNSYLPRLTPILCLLCAASFLGLNLGGDHMTWEQSRIYGYFPTQTVWTNGPWPLITSTFVHFQIMHILFNVMWLWSLGNVFEDELGSFRWGLFFVGAAWVSSALQLLGSGEIGIGMSGVVYALIGFGWIARVRIPSFAAILNQQTIILAIVWLVGCWVATQANLVNIANEAHLAGLAFGMGVAGIWFYAQKLRRAVAGAGAAGLLALSFVPLFWCPMSSDWTGLQAQRADERHDYATALHWYRRTVELDPTATWALHNMAIIYLNQKDQANYNRTLSELRSKDAKDAKEFDGN